MLGLGFVCVVVFFFKLRILNTMVSILDCPYSSSPAFPSFLPLRLFPFVEAKRGKCQCSLTLISDIYSVNSFSGSPFTPAPSLYIRYTDVRGCLKSIQRLQFYINSSSPFIHWTTKTQCIDACYSNKGSVFHPWFWGEMLSRWGQL